jgi:glutaredoxin
LTVTLLTAPNCASCEDAKRLLTRLAGEYGFSLHYKNFNSEEGEALAMKGMLLFPPGVVIDGDPVSYGRLSERAFRRELERRAVAQ